MTELRFPPTPDEAIPVIAIHVVFLTVLVAGIVKFAFERRRPAKQRDLLIWSAMVSFGVIILSHASDRVTFHGVRYSHDLLYLRYPIGWTLCFAIFGAYTFVRLCQQKGLRLGVLWWMLAYIALCVGLQPPVSPGPREAARRAQCKNHLRQIGLGILADNEALGHLVASSEGDPPVSWRVRLLPYLDQTALSRRYNHIQAWDANENLPVAREFVWVYHCPSSRQRIPSGTEQLQYTDFLMLTGPGTIGSPAVERPFTLKELADGASQTAIVVEACGILTRVWTEPKDFDTSQDPVGINIRGRGKLDSPGMLSSHHNRGAHLLMVDGTVRFVSQDIDPKVLHALTTVNGGESVPEN